MSHALVRRLQRLEHRAGVRLALDLAPAPEAQAAARTHVRALLTQYETPLTEKERTGWYVVPLEQRARGETCEVSSAMAGAGRFAPHGRIR